MFKRNALAGDKKDKLQGDFKLIKGIKTVMNQNKLVNAFISDDVKAHQDLITLREILQAEDKNNSSLLTLYSICQKMPFFKKLSSNIMKKVSSREVFLKFFERASYEYHPKDTLLIQEYDTLNTKAYVILRGKVGILRENREITGEVSPNRVGSPTQQSRRKSRVNFDQPELLKNRSGSSIFKETSPVRSKTGFSLMSSPIMQFQQKLPQAEQKRDEIDNHEDLYFGLDRSTISFLKNFGSLVAKIDKGNMFGDVALTSDVPRTASVVTLEDSELMIFTRENFQHIQKYYAMEFDDRKGFIKNRLPQVEEIKEEKRLTQFIQSFQPLALRRVNYSNPGRYCDKRRKVRSPDIFH